MTITERKPGASAARIHQALLKSGRGSPLGREVARRVAVAAPWWPRAAVVQYRHGQSMVRYLASVSNQILDSHSGLLSTLPDRRTASAIRRTGTVYGGQDPDVGAVWGMTLDGDPQAQAAIALCDTAEPDTLLDSPAVRTPDSTRLISVLRPDAPHPISNRAPAHPMAAPEPPRIPRLVSWPPTTPARSYGRLLTTVTPTAPPLGAGSRGACEARSPVTEPAGSLTPLEKDSMSGSQTGTWGVVRDLRRPVAKGARTCEDGPECQAPVHDVVVGAVLRAAREKAGVSRAQAAARLGVREARITRLETAQAAWSRQHARALARHYAMPEEEVDALEALFDYGHRHVVPDLSSDPGPQLTVLESRAVRIRIAAPTVPPYVYTWGTDDPHLTGYAADEMAPRLRPRPWPGCPVALLCDERILDYGYLDAPRTAARLRRLAAMVEAGDLTFRLLIPDFDIPFEPVGSELTLDDGTIVCVSEDPSLVTYSNGSWARDKGALLDRQFAAALDAEASLAALHRAAERWDHA